MRIPACIPARPTLVLTLGLAACLATGLATALAACKPEPPPPPVGSDTMGPKAPPPGALVLIDTTVAREDSVLRLSLTFPRADGPGADAVNAVYDSTLARVIATLVASIHETTAAAPPRRPGRRPTPFREPPTAVRR